LVVVKVAVRTKITEKNKAILTFPLKEK